MVLRRWIYPEANHHHRRSNWKTQGPKRRTKTFSHYSSHLDALRPLHSRKTPRFCHRNPDELQTNLIIGQATWLDSRGRHFIDMQVHVDIHDTGQQKFRKGTAQPVQAMALSIERDWRYNFLPHGPCPASSRTSWKVCKRVPDEHFGLGQYTWE